MRNNIKLFDFHNKIQFEYYNTSIGILQDNISARNQKSLKIVVENADNLNTIAVFGRITNQGSWILIDTLTSNGSKIFPISTYDYVRVSVQSYGSASNHVKINGSGF